ncbi:MAG TPA: nucleotidyltransferase domain-containing protein [Terriglobales bacterium]|nr:nucleotidyltransferase domain-containing protein [Terriglobales bacterium]
MSRAQQLISAVRQSGFPYLDSLIHLFVGGSELHGAKVKNTDDLDIYGVYLEPPELVLGLEKQDFYVWSTAGNERRNGPDDIDVCLYSLRKWAGLAAKGNPTALHFLFSQNYASEPEPWNDVLKHRDLFISRRASAQFRGFAEAQLRRLQGIGAGKKGQRHELIGAHGYDIKAAMHVIRLLNEGIELMRSGTITLPRPEKELLINIRTGNYGSLESVLDLANRLFAELEKAETASRLPEKVDKARISTVVSRKYLSFWNRSGLGHS